jgi:peroxiredoxin
VQLAGWQERFEVLGVAVAAMTYDPVPVLRAFHEAEALSYPLLHDERAQHVDAFGIRNEAYAPGDDAWGIPHPGIVWIDEAGVIRGTWAVPDYRERPPFEDVHAALAAALAP